MPSLTMMTSTVSAESLARDTHTHTDRQIHIDRQTDVSVIFRKVCSRKTKKPTYITYNIYTHGQKKHDKGHWLSKSLSVLQSVYALHLCIMGEWAKSTKGSDRKSNRTR